MSSTTPDSSKRTWLIASCCAGAVGAGFTAVPFVSSFQPSERAKAAGAPVEVDIAAISPGGNEPAPDNLEVPSHMYLSDSRLLIGADQSA